VIEGIPDGIREAVQRKVWSYLVSDPGTPAQLKRDSYDCADAVMLTLLTELERMKWVPPYLNDLVHTTKAWARTGRRETWADLVVDELDKCGPLVTEQPNE
jgi:hypothetical protein